MQDLPVLIAIAGFTVMGIGAIAKPALVTSQLGIFEPTPAGRNEVRTVYGGLGLFMALGGMAAGRLVSAVIDRAIDRAPLGYLGLEVLVAVMLLAVA
jgi:hypothetical protein